MNSIYFTTNQFTRKPSGRSRFHPGYFCIHMTTNVHKETNRRLCRPTFARTIPTSREPILRLFKSGGTSVRVKYTTPFEDFMYPIFCHMPAGMKFILASVAVID